MPEALQSGDRLIRVLVADGSRIHTQLLVEALRRDPAFLVSAFELESSSLAASVKNQDIDVLLMSSTFDEKAGRGCELLRSVRSAIPRLKAVMLLDSSTDEAVLRAFHAGARGIVSRGESLETLNQCVRRVWAGHIWANDGQLALAIEALAAAPMVRAVNAKGMSLLSKRELQIVRSLAEGLTNREIAERLKLSQHTVKNYLFRVFDKLGVSSRVELLFMTLAESEQEPAMSGNSRPSGEGAGDEFSRFLKSAESGLPLSQLALAQMYLSLQNQPGNPVSAYAWYLLASERAAQTKQQIASTMTAEQIEEAHQKAKLWLTRLQSLETPAAPPIPAKSGPPEARKETARGKAAH
ncbi:MAG TPA: response regulator transcription factor [Candidatus Sulfotelmatobacter sp.]